MTFVPKTYKGKTLGEIYDEAFRSLGSAATKEQVKIYSKKEYGLKQLYGTAYDSAKWRASLLKPHEFGEPVKPTKIGDYCLTSGDTVQRKYSVIDCVIMTNRLADSLGGYDQLEKLISVLKGTGLRRTDEKS